MKYAAGFCAVTGLALLLAGCAATADTHDADVKALHDNEVQWNQDFVSKDVEKLLSHYADDAVLMGPGMPSSSGKDAIRKTLQGMVADPALSLKFVSVRESPGPASAENWRLSGSRFESVVTCFSEK